MGNYYLGVYSLSNDLAHHGIKGQKWGIRRYQNPDGTLTAEGRARYGENGLGVYGNRKQSFVRRVVTGDIGTPFNSARIRQKREVKYAEKAKNAETEGLRREYQHKSDVYKEANIARDRYTSNRSTGELVAKQLLLSPIFGTANYQTLRGLGYGPVMSAGASVVPSMVLGPIGSLGVSNYITYKAAEQALNNKR